VRIFLIAGPPVARHPRRSKKSFLSVGAAPESPIPPSEGAACLEEALGAVRRAASESSANLLLRDL